METEMIMECECGRNMDRIFHDIGCPDCGTMNEPANGKWVRKTKHPNSLIPHLFMWNITGVIVFGYGTFIKGAPMATWWIYVALSFFIYAQCIALERVRWRSKNSS